MNTRALTVMLIEDNEDHAELVTSALKFNNLVGEVVHFATAELGMEHIYNETGKTPRTLPDLILLDLMLPGMGGMEMLKVLKSRAETKSIPVVVLTTSSHDKKIAKAYELGANSYIAKPLAHEDFVIKLAELNMFWSLTAELPHPVVKSANAKNEPPGR
jgi:two-component system response regulator